MQFMFYNYLIFIHIAVASKINFGIEYFNIVIKVNVQLLCFGDELL